MFNEMTISPLFCLFVSTGRLFDKYGNMKEWWTQQSAEKFTELTQCMIQQYSNYTVEGKHVSSASNGLAIEVVYQSTIIFQPDVRL